MSRCSRCLPVLVTCFLAGCAGPGLCYRTAVGEGPDAIPVYVVSGNAKQMGEALGKMMGKDAERCLRGWLDAARKEDPERYSDKALDQAWKRIAPHTDNRFKDELEGITEGAGMDEDFVRRAHMIPVVSDYACSGVAVWGRATREGRLLQLRNLDFTVGAGLEDHPAIVVYRPTDGQVHVSVTVAGYVGCNTGMNAAGVVLGEKGESPKKDRPFNLDGTHFATLFRRVLHDAKDLNQALTMIREAKLIKRYYFYVSGPQSGGQSARKIKVTSPDPVRLHVWSDNDPADELAPKVIPQAIYHTMNNTLAYQHLTANWGLYDAEKMIDLSRAVASRNGNLLNVVYDPAAKVIWVAFAEGSEHAFQRPYVRVPLAPFFDKDKVPAGAAVLEEEKDDEKD